MRQFTAFLAALLLTSLASLHAADAPKPTEKPNILLMAVPDATTFPKPPSIKGLQVQMVEDALALGIHHAGVNVNITGLVDLEKRPENPKRVVDGYEFSFHESYLKVLDAQIKPHRDAITSTPSPSSPSTSTGMSPGIPIRKTSVIPGPGGTRW